MSSEPVWRGEYDYYEPLTIGTQSGEVVGPDSGLRLSAYFACCKVVSEDTAKLPLITYERLQPKGKTPARDHPVYRLLHLAPSDEYTSMTFRETLMYQCLSRGNGYAEIQRNGLGVPIALHLVDADRVEPKRNDDGSIYYEIRQPNGERINIRSFDMLHVRGIGTPLRGWSVARIAAESLGVGLATQTFAATYFGNGTNVGGVLELPKLLNKVGRDAIRESFEQQHKTARLAHKPIVLWQGVTYKPLEVKADEAQFIESREFSVEDICRWFRVPPHKIQHLKRATYSNIEHQGIEYVTDTLIPWLTRIEQEFNRKLFFDEEEYFCEHAVQALLRGDSTSRSQFYRTMFEIGVFSSNDIAELENRNPIPGGDQRFVPANMMPLNGTMDDESEDDDEDDLEEDPEDESPAAPPGRDIEAIFRRVIEDESAKIMRVERKIVERLSANASVDIAEIAKEIIANGTRMSAAIEAIFLAFTDGMNCDADKRMFETIYAATAKEEYGAKPRDQWMAVADSRANVMPMKIAAFWGRVLEKQSHDPK